MNRVRRGLKRLRHRKGHGVHSPYIYSIVREVFMTKSHNKTATPLRERLKSINTKDRVSHQIENLASHCGYTDFSVDSFQDGYQLVICTTAITTESTLDIITHSEQSGTTVVVMSPYSSREREILTDKIVESHHSTTIDKREYLVIFNNHLPKQHFEL
ncbi:MAG: hypothetical protein SNH13_07805 [Rikenellaceae bacterium]